LREIKYGIQRTAGVVCIVGITQKDSCLYQVKRFWNGFFVLPFQGVCVIMNIYFTQGVAIGLDFIATSWRYIVRFLYAITICATCIQRKIGWKPILIQPNGNALG